MRLHNEYTFAKGWTDSLSGRIKQDEPLWYLQAEELGADAALLGKNITRVFEMATDWNALIRLDGKVLRFAKDSRLTSLIYLNRGGRVHGRALTFGRNSQRACLQ